MEGKRQILFENTELFFQENLSHKRVHINNQCQKITLYPKRKKKNSGSEKLHLSKTWLQSKLDSN